MSMFWWALAGFLLPALITLLWVITKKTTGGIKLPTVSSKGKVLGALIIVIVLGLVVWFLKDKFLEMNFFSMLFLAFTVMFIGWRLNNGVKFRPGAVLFWGGVILVVGVLIWNSNYGRWLKNEIEQHEAGFPNDCPEVGGLADVIEVTEGQRVTVKLGCPLFINQRQLAETGFILDAVDERFREYKPGQLINTAQKFPGVEKYPACVIDSKKVVRGSRCHMVQVTAVEWAYNELGLEEVHFIVKKPKSEEIIPRLTL